MKSWESQLESWSKVDDQQAPTQRVSLIYERRFLLVLIVGFFHSFKTTTRPILSRAPFFRYHFASGDFRTSPLEAAARSSKRVNLDGRKQRASIAIGQSAFQAQTELLQIQRVNPYEK